MNCSQITSNIIGAICGKLPKSGLDDTVILLNYNDIDFTESTANGNVISEIVLKDGKTGYSFTSFGASYAETGATLNVGTYVNTWTHSLSLRIFAKNQPVKDFINKLAAGAKIVAIVKNNEAGNDGDVKYEAYGWDNGLEVSEGAGVVELTDGAAYTLKMASKESAQESEIVKSVFAGTIAATETMIDSLTTQANP